MLPIHWASSKVPIRAERTSELVSDAPILLTHDRCGSGNHDRPGGYDEFAVPASGAPLFQAATANLNPWTQAKADFTNPERGPMLIVSGEKDNTAPHAIVNAIYKLQHKNEHLTEFVELPNRGHALTIDSGWREVADTALTFIKRFI